MATLEVRGLNQFYGESHTLWDIEFDVPEGQCVCIMGRNGVGKTTLLRALMGVLPATGSVRFDGQELMGKPAELRPRIGIGYVPQGREIFAQLTVKENLETGLGARRSGGRGIPPLVFELFPVLKDMLGRRGGDLSGGQQQQLAFGRALVLEPKLLLLDEPTEGIQPNIVQQIGDVVEKLREPDILKEIQDAVEKLHEEHGMTILLVEQKLAFARRVAQRFSIFDRGRLTASGEMSALDDDLVNKYLKV